MCFHMFVQMVWLRSLRRCIQIVSWWSRMRIGRELGKGGFSLVQVSHLHSYIPHFVYPWALV